ncbi:hypothetical protein C8F04DRAFT_1154875, partial [Mycena alexandri]
MGSNISSVAATAADRVVGSVLPKSFEIVMIGLDNAGKTSLVNRFKRRELPSGPSGSTIETIPFGRHSVTIRELGGADKIRPLWRLYVLSTKYSFHLNLKTVFWNGHGFIFAQQMDLAGAAELHRISEALGVEELRVAKRRTVDIKSFPSSGA